MQIGGTLLTLRTMHFTVELVAPVVSITRRGFHVYVDTTVELTKIIGGVAYICDILILGFGLSIIFPIKLVQ